TQNQRAHQLAFLIPGIIPSFARLRKQIRQMPNLRYTARARPHSLQRRLMLIFSRGSILAFAGACLLASCFFICWRNLTFGGVADAWVAELKPNGVGLTYATYVGGAEASFRQAPSGRSENLPPAVAPGF